ncbi:fucosyltransferase 9 [Oncorhynchus mykiss]|uniref:Fucosyltransferase n=1 Tax=Oncorhynchus mykiss TaxID=8022 RepID=Q70G09_ONCMY|nr:fucosyltransferase 9 [Oncorhynchus mykiss]CAE46911.1 alpha3-fucosyltransferase 9 [Oncorhynchus mykiss]
MLGQGMSTPASQSGLRPVLMMTFLLGLSFMYYKPQIKFLSCPINQASHLGKARCPPCPQVCRARNQMVNQTHMPRQPLRMTIILIWPIDHTFDIDSCAYFNIKGCHLTVDKNLYSKAHGVIFHHRDIHGDLKNMPQEQRPWFQKWVWWNAESPANTNRIPGVDHLFNLTASYRLDSDIKVPYGSLVEVRSEDNIFELPKKDKLVCWVVSNWNPNYKRVQVFNELSRHVKIEAYGRHFSRYLENEDYSKTLSSCKFYLAFENSIYKDYATEKLFNAMKLGAVPVVLGPSRDNYEQFIPRDSFIHVDDFSSTEELAKKLLFLDQNEEECMRYFTWQNNFEVQQGYFGLEHNCRS